MKTLQKLGRKLSKKEQVLINGGVDRCGYKCKDNDKSDCCKLGCPHAPKVKYCSFVPTNGVIDDVPIIV